MIEYARCLEIVKFNYSEISRMFVEIKNSININNVKTKHLTSLLSYIKALSRCGTFLTKSYKNVEIIYDHYSPEEKHVINEYHDLEKKLNKLIDDISYYSQTIEKTLINDSICNI